MPNPGLSQALRVDDWEAPQVVGGPGSPGPDVSNGTGRVTASTLSRCEGRTAPKRDMSRGGVVPSYIHLHHPHVSMTMDVI